MYINDILLLVVFLLGGGAAGDIFLYLYLHLSAIPNAVRPSVTSHFLEVNVNAQVCLPPSALIK